MYSLYLVADCQARTNSFVKKMKYFKSFFAIRYVVCEKGCVYIALTQYVVLERATGLEPAAHSLGSCCATIALRPLTFTNGFRIQEQVGYFPDRPISAFCLCYIVGGDPCLRNRVIDSHRKTHPFH